MFVFKGISSEDMQVVVEEEENLLGKASQRYIQTDIEGRDGALFEEQGYTTIIKNIKFYVLNKEKLDVILAWLDGKGVLEINNRKTIARFYAEVNPIRTSSIQTIDTTFIRNPFWEKCNDEYVSVNNSIINEGTIYSDPIIKLKKNTLDEIDITINGLRFEYDFDGEGYVEIDCKEKTVLYEGLNRNRQITIGYDFPRLDKGKNVVTIHSGDADILIKRKDMWL